MKKIIIGIVVAAVLIVVISAIFGGGLIQTGLGVGGGIAAIFLGGNDLA
jgi:hypothetical protein